MTNLVSSNRHGLIDAVAASSGCRDDLDPADRRAGLGALLPPDARVRRQRRHRQRAASDLDEIVAGASRRSVDDAKVRVADVYRQALEEVEGTFVRYPIPLLTGPLPLRPSTGPPDQKDASGDTDDDCRQGIHERPEERDSGVAHVMVGPLGPLRPTSSHAPSVSAGRVAAVDAATMLTVAGRRPPELPRDVRREAILCDDLVVLPAEPVSRSAALPPLGPARRQARAASLPLARARRRRAPRHRPTTTG